MGCQVTAASTMAAGARTQRSLNTVTVPARSISCPNLLTMKNSEHTFDAHRGGGVGNDVEHVDG